jgi:phosphopentomutase
VTGFERGLRELDEVLPRILEPIRPEDLIIFTADHGNDPTTPSTDHSREVVPVLALGPRIHSIPLGVRRTLADIGQTVADYLGVAPLASGTSFLGALLHG